MLGKPGFWYDNGPMDGKMGRTAQEHQLNRATPLDNHTGSRGWGLGRVHIRYQPVREGKVLAHGYIWRMEEGGKVKGQGWKYQNIRHTQYKRYSAYN